MARPRSGLSQRCEVVLIGSSTNGPQTFAAALKQLPAKFPVPIVVVQQMPQAFTLHLANRLDQEIALEGLEALDKLRPQLSLETTMRGLQINITSRILQPTVA